MYRTMLVLGSVVGAFSLASTGPLGAAELAVSHHEAYAAPADCGPCGCLTVKYVYHRQLETTYGVAFDPRNYDTTEPHYFLGPIRRYPRYFVDGEPVPVGGWCWR
jgi:hypothetical protein